MSTNGVILERLSGKKLSVLVSFLLSLQVAFFLIGALKFPNASHTETVEGIMCRDKEAYAKWNQPPNSKKTSKTNAVNKENSNLYYLRDYLGIFENLTYLKFNFFSIFYKTYDWYFNFKILIVEFRFSPLFASIQNNVY